MLASPTNSLIVVQDADAGLSFSSATLTVPKNVTNGIARIPVICSNPSVEPPVATNITPLSVHYATADGTATNGQDYSAVTGTLVFTGQLYPALVHNVIHRGICNRRQANPVTHSI